MSGFLTNNNIINQLGVKTIPHLASAINFLHFHEKFELPVHTITYDDAWDRLFVCLKNLRRKLGEEKTDQLLAMAARSKVHYDTGYEASGGKKGGQGDPGQDEIKLGSRLLQDVEEIARGRAPFAYPKRLYVWPREPDIPDPKNVPLSPAHAKVFEELETLKENLNEYLEESFPTERASLSATILAHSDQIGSPIAAQLLDMMQQVDRHYGTKEPGLGDCLLTDIGRILCGRLAPWHYRESLYRWATKPELKKYYQKFRST
jgi:hypothetical protein